MKRFGSLLLTAMLVSSLAHGAPGASYSGGVPLFGANHESKTSSDERVSKDGSAGWVVPFEVPPGRAGVQPSVALTYSSRGAVRGGIAVGWSLPVSKIELDTTQGRAQAVNYSIDGRRLVRVSDASVAAGVEAFRAQDDDTFTRYEHVLDGTESGRWVARSLDGTTRTFGSADGSRDVRSEGAAGDRIFGGVGRWFLDAVVDAAGNRISYSYGKTIGRPKHSAGQGVVFNVDLTLARIEYGANDTVANSTPHARVEFSWGTPEYCPGSYVPIGSSFTFRNGVRTYQGANKLLSIQAQVRSGNTWALRRELTLNYDANAASCTQLHGPLRVLTSVQERATSADGLVTTLPAQTFEYGPLFPDFSAVAPVQTDVVLAAGKNPHHPEKAGGWPALDALPIDLNGDATREVLTSCTGLPRMPWANEPNMNSSSDLNAREGCSPTAQVTHRQIPRGQYACQSSGSTFFGYRFFDVTGDGLPDLVAAMNYQKGSYIAEDDVGLRQLYPQAYPACSTLPPPPCTYGSDTRNLCWLNTQTQAISREGGDTFFSPTQPVGGGAGTPETGVTCPSGTCQRIAGCDLDVGQCCTEEACRPQGYGPVTDPPVPGPTGSQGSQANHFVGPGPIAQERTATIQETSPHCAFVPDTHCGHYVWWVYANKGTPSQGSQFETQPRIVFSPIPLESDNMTTNSGAGALASASMYRATGDLDGDGFPDAIYQTPEDVMSTQDLQQYDFHVWWGNGTGGFQQPNGGRGVMWPTPAFGTARAHIEASGSNLNPLDNITRKRNMLADFNGDGLLDYVVDTRVYFNTGTGFEPTPTDLRIGSAFDDFQRTERVAVVPPSTGFDDAFTVSTVRMVDLDLDGLEDLVLLGTPNSYNPFVAPSAAVRAFINVGDGFSELTSTEAARLTVWRQALQGITIDHAQTWKQRTDLVDLNADGLPDLISAENWGCPSGPLSQGQLFDMSGCGLQGFVRTAPSIPLRALTAVNTGTGARIEFRYASTNDPQIVTRSADSRLMSPLWVVKQMVVSSGTVGEAQQVTDYRYENPVSNRDEFGRFAFRGFSRTVTTGPTPATGRRLRTIRDWAFDQDNDGLLARELEGEVWSLHDGHEDLVRRKDYSWRALGLFAPYTLTGPSQPALTVWAQSEVRNTTCRTPLVGLLASADACVAGGLSNRTLTTWSELLAPPDSFGAQLVMAYRASATRRTTNSAPTTQPDDQLSSTGVEFRRTPVELRLLTTSRETTNGSGVVLQRDESSYEPTRRAAVTEARRSLDSSAIARTRFTYDPYGNVKYVMRPNQVAALLAGQAAKSIAYTYDSFGVHRATENNELGHLTRATTDLATGRVTLKEGVAQQGLIPTERTRFDGFGRPLEVWRKVLVGSTFNEQLVGTFTYVDTAPRSVVEQQLKSGTSWIPTTTFLDGLGRATRIERPADGLTEVVRRQFDGAGNAVAVFKTSPSGVGEALYWTQFDAFGRATRVKNTDSAQLITIYTGNYTTIYEWPEDGGPLMYRLIDSDALGRATTVFEGLQTMTQTRYAYDALDRVKQVTDADGVISNITYDLAGRRTLVERAGNKVETHFDFDGNRTAALFPTPSGVADPVKYATYWAYDELDRVTTIAPMERDLSSALRDSLDWTPTGKNATFTLTYDTGDKAVGRLSTVKAPWGTTTYGYTMEGWRASETREIALKPDTYQFMHSSTQTWTYDLLGNVIGTTHPDGYSTGATFETDGRGRPLAAVLLGVSPREVARFQRNAAGAVIGRTTPTAGSSQTWTYDSMGRVLSTSVQGQWCDPACTAGTIAGEQFGYFETGHPRSMTDLAKGRIFDFLYSDHLELRDARTRGNTDYVGTFTYSPTGRVLTANVSTKIAGSDVVARSTTSNYTPWSSSDRADPAAVRSLRRADGSALATLTWDAAGNLVRKIDDTATLDFATDARDAVREVRDQNGRRELYWYDHNGQRVLVYRSAPASGGGPEVVHRFGNTEVTLKTDGSRSSTVDVLLGANAVARVANGNTVAPELLFHGSLQSLLAVQNVSGTVTARFGYGPWGETLYEEGNSALRYDRRYEGKARDAFSKLSYFGFRYYDAVTMAWTQGDPLYRRFPDAAGTDPRRMSPYVYVLNDPLTLVDPDGRDSFLSTMLRIALDEKPKQQEERKTAQTVPPSGGMPASPTPDGRRVPGTLPGGRPATLTQCPADGPDPRVAPVEQGHQKSRGVGDAEMVERLNATFKHLDQDRQIGFMTGDDVKAQNAVDAIVALLQGLGEGMHRSQEMKDKTNAKVREGQSWDRSIRAAEMDAPRIMAPVRPPMPTPD